MNTGHQNAITTGNGAPAGQALRASELNYRRLFEAAQDGILILNVDTGRISDANPILTELMGLSRDEMIGKTVGELGPFKNNGSNKIMFERLQKDGYIRCDNLPLETGDGRKIAVELIGNVYQAGDKKMIQCHIRDINGHKRVEETLRQSEEHYHGLFEHMVEGYAYCKMIFENGEPRDWTYLAVNPMFEKLTGLKGVAGKRVSEDIPRLAETDPEVFKIYGRVSLTGKAERFEMFVQALQQWFAVSVYSPEKEFFVAVFDVITGRKITEEKLKLTRALMENSADAIHVVDPATGRFLDMNEQACRTLGYTRDEHLALTVFDVTVGVDRALFDETIARARKAGHVTVEARHRRKDGSTFPVEVSLTPVTLDREYLVVIVRDFTERKRAENELQKVNRALRLISLCNQELVHATDEAALLQAVCRLAVEQGGHRMAWVGFAEQDEAKSVRPVAQAGFEKDYLEAMNLTWADAERGRGPTGTAIRTGKPALIRDFSTDPAVAFWRAEASQRGYASSIALPIITEGRCIGALMMYAAKPDAFDPEEIELLNEMAGDLAYGIGALRHRAERKKAMEAVRESERRFQTLADTSPVGIFRTDAQGQTTYVNPRWCGISGLSATEAMGDGWLRAVHPEDREKLAQGWQAATEAQSISKTDYRFVRPDGSISWVMGQAVPEKDDAGRVVGYVGTITDITERKRAEDALRGSETLLKETQTIAGLGSYTMAIPVGLWRGSDVLDQIFGIDKTYECSVEGWKNLIHPDDRAMMLDYLRNEVFGRGVAFDKEYRIIRHNDQAERWVHGLGRLEFDAQGRPVRMLGTIQDITEHRRAEEEKQRRAAVLEAQISSTIDGILIVDEKGNKIVQNQRCIELWKIPKHIVENGDDKQQVEFVKNRTKDPEKFVEKVLYLYAHPNETSRDEVEFKDGIILDRYSAPVVGKDGTCFGRIWVFRDITERKRVEESQARLATAVEQSAETIVITDTHGTILYANPAFEKITGYTRAEALGQNPRILKSGQHNAEFYRRMWEVLGRGETWSGHITNRRKDGKLYDEEATISPIRDAAGKIVNYVAVKRDVTREMQLEAQFHQAQKMEAVGQLAGGVAHDFNNILGVIIGYGELIAEDLEPDSPLRTYAEEIRQAAERAKGLTQQLLLFSRKQNVQLVVLDLNETVKNLEKMLRRLIGENVEMALVPGSEIGRIKADTGYIGQVLMNLTVNARDAMPHGGKLTIATRNVTLSPLPASPLTPSLVPVRGVKGGEGDTLPVTLDENYTRTRQGVLPGNYVMLAVSDTGTGMTPEVKARIFEALFTTKPAGKGTGLGLATCHSIVQQSGGHIEVDTEVGKGTTFKLYFPRVDKPVAAAAAQVQAGPLPRGTETLLIVEDEALVRHLAWKVLESLGYHVLRASNGQDGLNLARDHKGSPIRLVVTDVVMPRMGGKVMADWLKTIYPDVKILFSSGYTDDALAQQGVLEPAVAFLPKPYAPAVLARKVRAMLDDQTDAAQLRKPGAATNQPPAGST